MQELLGKLRALLGDEHVLTEDDELRFHVSDFTDETGALPAAVVRPGTVGDAVEVALLAAAAGVHLVARGGGMSYTKAHLTERPGGLLVDTRRLDRVREVNVADRYVDVDAGVTWARLFAALAGTGKRVSFGGTLSGRFATVGGTVSQNSVGLGKGWLHDAVLGVEVILADGRLLRTGSGAADGTAPFLRYFGPDLTGLFIGDSGAFGVKTGVTIRLDPVPGGLAYLCFSFRDVESLVGAQVEMGGTDLVAECFGADSFMNRAMADLPAPPAQEALTLARAVLAAGSSRPRAVRQLLRGARPSMRYLADVDYSLAVVCEGSDAAAADRAARKVRQIARRHGGRDLPSTLAIGIRHAPFGEIHPLMLGGRGEGVLPSNALFPLSAAPTVVRELNRFRAEHRDLLDRHGITIAGNYLLAGHTWGVEPIIVWKSRPTEYRLHWAPPDVRARFAAEVRDDDAEAAVVDLRSRLIGSFRELGATHIQLGRVYPYRQALDGTPAWDLVRGFHGLVDPDRRVNPGVLGL